MLWFDPLVQFSWFFVIESRVNNLLIKYNNGNLMFHLCLPRIVLNSFPLIGPPVLFNKHNGFQSAVLYNFCKLNKNKYLNWLYTLLLIYFQKLVLELTLYHSKLNIRQWMQFSPVGGEKGKFYMYMTGGERKYFVSLSRFTFTCKKLEGIILIWVICFITPENVNTGRFIAYSLLNEQKYCS